jgi:hypothetical protein
MRVDQITIARLCHDYAERMLLPADCGLDAARVLWALAGAESSFGQDFAPRHEASYCRGGRYFDIAATRDYGCLAHCSYTPWQIMYANFQTGMWPPYLLDEVTSPAVGIRTAIARINKAIQEGARTLAQIADAYNSGSFRDSVIPVAYINDVQEKYLIEMPEIIPAGESAT